MSEEMMNIPHRCFPTKINLYIKTSKTLLVDTSQPVDMKDLLTDHEVPLQGLHDS